MQSKLIYIFWLIFYLLNYASFGHTQGFSIPNLLSKLTIPSISSLTTPAPRTLPSIRFNIEPAHNGADCIGPLSRTIPEPLLPVLSSMYSQIGGTHKQSPTNIPIGSDFLELLAQSNRARIHTEEPTVNTHIYLYTAPEDNIKIDKSEQLLTNYPSKLHEIVLIKDPTINLQNAGISIGKHPQPERTLIYVVNKQPSSIVKNRIFEVASIPRNPDIHFVNYLPLEAVPFIQENIQANLRLTEILAQAVANPKPTLAQHPFSGPVLQTLNPEAIGNYLQNIQQHPVSSTPAFIPFNQLPIPPYFPPFGYNPINQLIPPHSTNGATLLANTLPTILQRISNAPPPVESGTEFRLKLKGLI